MLEWWHLDLPSVFSNWSELSLVNRGGLASVPVTEIGHIGRFRSSFFAVHIMTRPNALCHRSSYSVRRHSPDPTFAPEPASYGRRRTSVCCHAQDRQSQRAFHRDQGHPDPEISSMLP